MSETDLSLETDLSGPIYGFPLECKGKPAGHGFTRKPGPLRPQPSCSTIHQPITSKNVSMIFESAGMPAADTCGTGQVSNSSRPPQAPCHNKRMAFLQVQYVPSVLGQGRQYLAFWICCASCLTKHLHCLRRLLGDCRLCSIEAVLRDTELQVDVCHESLPSFAITSCM